MHTDAISDDRRCWHPGAGVAAEDTTNVNTTGYAGLGTMAAHAAVGRAAGRRTPFGCTEQKVGFTVAVYDKIEPEPSHRPILASQIPIPSKFEGGVNTIVAGGVGVAGGVLTALGISAARSGGSRENTDAGDSQS